MSQRPMHKVADRWFAALEDAVDASEVTWVLSASGATGLPDVGSFEDVILHCGTEKVLVTAVAIDTPSAGLDSLTVQRGYGGSAAASHAADTAVAHYYYEDYHNDLSARLAAAESIIVWLLGDANGVAQDGGLQVTETGTPGMTVEVSAGRAVVDGQPVWLRAVATTGTITAPTGGDSRIDVVRLSQLGVVSVVTGTPSGSPVAPAVGSGYLKLAEILLTTGMTAIEDADITITLEADGLYL